MKAFMMWFLKRYYFAPDRRAAISWARDNCESLEEFWREANPDYVMALANIPGVLNAVTGTEYALYIVKHYGKCSSAELANWLRKNAKPNFGEGKDE